MNKKHFLSGIIVIVMAGVLAVVIGYAINPRPIEITDELTSVNASTAIEMATETDTDETTIKKKPCECCAERKTRLAKKIEAARKRRLQKQQAQLP